MSAKIIGNEKAIALINTAKPGDPHILTSKDMLDSLPDEYVAKAALVAFDPASAFVTVGGKGDKERFMPAAEKFYADLADARGIEGTSEIKCEPIYEEVDYNRLLCKPIEEPPMLRKINCGFRVIKWGLVLGEDGVKRKCSPVIVDFNAWKRCCGFWSDEEEKTNGYDPVLQKKMPNGNVYYDQFYFEDGQQKTYKLFPKYDNKFKRRKHLDELQKFDQRNADTKAWHTLVRKVAGMDTGYSKAQLAAGYFVVTKIIQSPESVKLDAMARRHAIANGLDHTKQLTNQLFGDQGTTEPETATFEPEQEPEPVITSTPVSGTTSDGVEFLVEEDTPQATMNGILAQIKTKREKAIYTLKHYIDTGMILEKDKEKTVKMISWMEKFPEAENSEKGWPQVITNLKDIESSIPEQGRLTHGLYPKETTQNEFDIY
jgi:hypothetical protein